MYNRYIFEPDGTCRRRQIPELPPEEPPAPENRSGGSAGKNTGIFSGLLPQGLDTGDLFVVLLLLLMAGDSPEQRDQALLTLALYFIL